MKRVLLIEPNYVKSKNKNGEQFPPIGLMKISSYHKKRGDKVKFFKGTNSEFNKLFSDKYRFGKIYIQTDFTFHFKKTKEAIQLAKKHAQQKNIYLGGVGATLLKEEYEKLGVNVFSGLLFSSNLIALKSQFFGNRHF